MVNQANIDPAISSKQRKHLRVTKVKPSRSITSRKGST